MVPTDFRGNVSIKVISETIVLDVSSRTVLHANVGVSNLVEADFPFSDGGVANKIP